MAKYHLNFKERMKIHKLLTENGKMDIGYYVYNNGWNDERVAKEVGGQVKFGHVANHRLSEFGKIAAPMLASKYNVMEEIENLKKRLDALEDIYLTTGDGK